jgi:hypothetical protein
METPPGPLRRWLLQGQVREMDGPYEQERSHPHEHPWWQVMCLTGVDYFSTLGYQPGIAALAAGALSPLATLILALLTLFGAYPIYSRVAVESPHGEGSVSMLERLLSWWTSKLFVLCLLGFVATDFVITITLSAADATAHAIENPYFPAAFQHHVIGVTLFLVSLLAAIFLKGFKEAIGIAVFLVGTYLLLNADVIAVAFGQIVQHPVVLSQRKQSLFAQHSNVGAMIAVSLLLFPRLALGLSGFETGVAVMPLVKGDPSDTVENPAGRIRNTRTLLLTAALIMSVFLLTSSFVTTTLIPHREFLPGGKANGRALAYLAHQYAGAAFGTAYDISTILILWFAGASAMAGLLNIVPRYLPRYGMAPDWTRAVRPLVLVFTAIAFLVTIIFKADVDKQGGAYATGVLVLMSSAAIAVTLSMKSQKKNSATVLFSLIALTFIYTTVVNVIERPEGIKIASIFIASIVIVSFVSRIWRSTELRVERVELDETARRFVEELNQQGELRIIANQRQAGDEREYRLKAQEQREDNHIPQDAPFLLLEVEVEDASEFVDVIEVRGVELVGKDGTRYRILRAKGSAVPNAIAAFLLYLRDTTGKIPHAYFTWSEGNPLLFLLRFVLLGQGDTAPVTREVLRQAERDPHRRPVIHAGG